MSRTFALSIASLGEALREPIRVAYLLCRIVDTVEDDSALPVHERRALFDAFDDLVRDDLRSADAFVARSLATEVGGIGKADHELCVEARQVFLVFRALPIERRAALRPHILEMSRGMREYAGRADVVGKLRLADLHDLERYCYFVAGTVGKLLTALFEPEVPSMAHHARNEARARAVSFGVALQLVNIVKDVAEDFTRGDCFLPEALAAEHGLALDSLFLPDHREAGLAVIRAVCTRAREHLRRAREYTLLWPADEGAEVRLFCSVPLALALATLHEVEHGRDTLVPGRTPKVSRDVVFQIFGDAQQAIPSNDALASMLASYGSGAHRGASPAEVGASA
ncbi:MAG: squalene/phytoene synthase family protein [Deltaproteobacteria bacterium]|nr:squalene/phytoene synthase family protein [Deltaproteobacteria bacterium]